LGRGTPWLINPTEGGGGSIPDSRERRGAGSGEEKKNSWGPKEGEGIDKTGGLGISTSMVKGRGKGADAASLEEVTVAVRAGAFSRRLDNNKARSKVLGEEAAGDEEEADLELEAGGGRMEGRWATERSKGAIDSKDKGGIGQESYISSTNPLNKLDPLKMGRKRIN
jgi:hypothetical protein